MMRRETFAGWDFEEVWGIDEEASYPYLRFAQPVEMSRFEVGQVTLRFEEHGPDGLSFQLLFALGDESDGIEPALEAVTVTAGSWVETLPAGALSCSAGICSYQGPAGGIVLLVLGEDFARVSAPGIDLSATANPVELLLRIGDDRGAATVRLGGTLASPAPRPAVTSRSR